MTTPLHPTPSPRAAIIRTPLARARGLGSAKSGTEHFWLQRMTAISNLILVVVVLFQFLRLVGADHAAVRAALASPLLGLPLLALIISGMIHMRLGMQMIIEDYISSEGSKVLALLANTFFAILVGLTCVYAVAKITFGA
ncbi:MAG: succinate dehydrogenase, hydrophobic membrane anchor protein [Hyphomicrobiaceae bacterium]